jgi:uncharacterized membrane protein YkoI
MTISNNLKKLTWKNPAICAGIALAGLLVFLSPLPQAIALQSNYTLPDIKGSANVGEQIKNLIEENTHTDFTTAATAAQNELAGNTLVEGNLGIIQGYLVYTFEAINNTDHSTTKVIVDAADGKVLYKSEPRLFAGFKKFQMPDISASKSLTEAANIAKGQVENGAVEMGGLRLQQETIVYEFMVSDSAGLKHSVTIDANSGAVLEVSDVMSMPWGHHGFGKMHHGMWGMAHGDGWCPHKDKESTTTTTPTSGDNA